MICQPCMLFSASLCTWKVVVDLQVAGLVAAGCKQQALGFYS